MIKLLPMVGIFTMDLFKNKFFYDLLLKMFVYYKAYVKSILSYILEGFHALTSGAFIPSASGLA